MRLPPPHRPHAFGLESQDAPALHSFDTTDHIALPGLLYERSRSSKSVTIWLQGNGGSSVFYSAERMNTLGGALTRRGIAFFTFENRGAEVEKMLKRRRGGRSEYATLGFAHELIRDCVKDIRDRKHFAVGSTEREVPSFSLLFPCALTSLT